MKTHQIDEQLVQEIANILAEYIEKIKNKHPKKAIRICKVGSKLMHLPLIKEELKDENVSD